MALVKAKLWIKLAQCEIDPADYDDAEKFADDYLLVNLLRKSSNLEVDADLESQACDSFYESEAINAQTNSRLANGGHPSWLYDVQERFRQILGPLTPSVLEKIVEMSGFGPGAIVGMKGRGMMSSTKYDETLSCTPRLVPFCRAIMGEPWFNHQDDTIDLVAGNEFFTVPKNAFKKRGCAKEPGMNQYLQTGIGTFQLYRLRLFGVDLKDQSWNQFLAGMAYERKLATIDLSNASDLNSDGLVFLLSTTEWYHLLQLARSHTTEINGKRVVLEKHSSMGNGYTFTLESAVFKAVVDSVVVDPDERLASTAVYGDDIIVPQWAAHEVIDRLEYLGFQVNSAKSHLAGDFFESCGKDFFRGVPVRPFFAKQEENDEGAKIPQALQLCNALRRYAAMRGVDGICDPRFKAAWLMLRAKIPTPWRSCRVPDHFGDVGVLSSREEVRGYNRNSPKAKEARERGLEGFIAKYVLTRPIKRDYESYGHFLAIARAIGNQEVPTLGEEPVRGYLRKPVVREALTVWEPGFEWPV